MKEKKRILIEESKLNNALYNLLKYLNFIEVASFIILIFIIMSCGMMTFLGFLNNENDNLKIGLLIILIAISVYVFIIKPILLIMYAIAKILINTGKQNKGSNDV